MFIMYNFCLYVTFISVCEAHKILVVFPIPVNSHRILGDALVATLLKAGHEVTYVTPYLKRDEQVSNLTQINVADNDRLLPDKSITDGITQKNDYNNLYNVLKYLSSMARSTVANENVQSLLKDHQQQFDLVVAEWMFSELYAGFSAVYQCPLIWISTMEPHWLVLRLVEFTWNPEFHTNLYSKIVHRPFTFQERLQEFVSLVKVSALKHTIINYMESHHYENLFVPILKNKRLDVPTFEELALNASLLMTNSHAVLASAAPLPPNCVSIGGYHIADNVTALPEAIQRTMDTAKHGVIYFSMGSYVSAKWPQYMLRDILQLFGNLNQTVLWKLDEVPSYLPDNVHIVPWAPQQGILKHPHCRLFITHGGLLSITEAVHFGVPVIGVPMFGDQFTNIANVEEKGFGKAIDISSNFAKDLKVAIEQVIGNSKYKEKAKQVSQMYHSLPSPRLRLVRWAEYVARTRGAPPSPALLPWHQHWCLDVILFTLTTVAFLLILFLRRK